MRLRHELSPEMMLSFFFSFLVSILVYCCLSRVMRRTLLYRLNGLVFVWLLYYLDFGGLCVIDKQINPATSQDYSRTRALSARIEWGT